MTRKLISRFERYDQSRRVLLKELSTLTPADLTAVYGPGRWSILQVVQHMVRAEYSVLQRLPAHSRLVNKNPDMRAHIGYLAVLFVLFFNIPVPVPESEMAPEDEEMILADLKNEWDRNIGWLKKYLKRLSTASAQRSVFSHPVTGPLTPGRAIRIAHLHLNTHRRQIARIRRRLIRTIRAV
jgi:uncharacterized damage-inducible protein DinB